MAASGAPNIYPAETEEGGGRAIPILTYRKTAHGVLKNAARRFLLEAKYRHGFGIPSHKEIKRVLNIEPDALADDIVTQRATLKDLEIMSLDELEVAVKNLLPNQYFRPYEGNRRLWRRSKKGKLTEQEFETTTIIDGKRLKRRATAIFDITRFFQKYGTLDKHGCPLVEMEQDKFRLNKEGRLIRKRIPPFWVGSKRYEARYTGIRFGCEDGPADLLIAQDRFIIVVGRGDERREQLWGAPMRDDFFRLINRLITVELNPNDRKRLMGHLPKEILPLKSDRKVETVKDSDLPELKKKRKLTPVQKKTLVALKEDLIYGNEFKKVIDEGYFCIKQGLTTLVKRGEVKRIVFYKDLILYYLPKYECHAQLMFNIYKRYGAYHSELAEIVQELGYDIDEVKEALPLLIKKGRLRFVKGVIDSKPEYLYYVDETMNKVVASLFVKGPLFPNEVSALVGKVGLNRTRLAPLFDAGKIRAIPVLNGSKWQNAYHLPHDEWLAKILEYIGMNIPTFSSDLDILAERIEKSPAEVRAGADRLVQPGRVHRIEATQVRTIKGEKKESVEQMYYYWYNETAARTVAYLFAKGPSFPAEIAKSEEVGTTTKNILLLAREYTGKKKIKTKEIKRIKDSQRFFYLPQDERMARALVYLGEQEPVYKREITRLAKLLKCSKEEVVADLEFLLEKKRIKCMEATRMERPEKRTTTKVYYLYNELSARIVACLHKNGPMFQIELANELRSTNVIRYYFDRLLKKKKIRRKYLSKGKMTEAIYFLRKDIRLMNILDYLGKHAMVLSSDIPKVAQAIKSTPRDVKMDLIFLAQTGRPMRMELRRIKKIKGKKTVETNQLYYLYDEEAAKVIRFLYINGPFLQSELARKFGMELMHANQLTVKMAKRGNIKRRNVGLPQKPINLVYLPMDEALAKEVKTQYAGRGRLSVVGDNHRGRAKTTQGVK